MECYISPRFFPFDIAVHYTYYHQECQRNGNTVSNKNGLGSRQAFNALLHLSLDIEIAAYFLSWCGFSRLSLRWWTLIISPTNTTNGILFYVMLHITSNISVLFCLSLRALHDFLGHDNDNNNYQLRNGAISLGDLVKEIRHFYNNCSNAMRCDASWGISLESQ